MVSHAAFEVSGGPIGSHQLHSLAERRRRACHEGTGEESAMKEALEVLWMDEILHHLEAMGNHCLLVFTGESSCQGFLGGAGFRPSTVARLCHFNSWFFLEDVLRTGDISNSVNLTIACLSKPRNLCHLENTHFTHVQQSPHLAARQRSHVSGSSILLNITLDMASLPTSSPQKGGL